MVLVAAPSGMPLSISFQVLPPSCVRKRCGRISSSRSVLTAAYAVCASKWPASMLKTFQKGFNSGGVTLSQCAPPSAVVQIRPSSVPAQMRLTSSGESPSA